MRLTFLSISLEIRMPIVRIAVAILLWKRRTVTCHSTNALIYWPLPPYDSAPSPYCAFQYNMPSVPILICQNSSIEKDSTTRLTSDQKIYEMMLQWQCCDAVSNIFYINIYGTKHFTLKPISNKNCFKIGLTKHFAHLGLSFNFLV